MDQSETISICFQLTLQDQDSLGEGTVYLLGNLYELGQWNLNKAIKMENLGANIYYANVYIKEQFPDAWKLEYQYLFIALQDPAMKVIDKKSMKFKVINEQKQKEKVIDDQWEDKKKGTETKIVYIKQKDELSEEDGQEFQRLFRDKINKRQKVYYKVMILNEKEYFKLFQVNEEALVFRIPDNSDQVSYFYFYECDKFVTGVTPFHKLESLNPNIQVYLFYYSNTNKEQLKICHKLFGKAFKLEENEVQLLKIQKSQIKVVWEIEEDDNKVLVESQEIQKILSLHRNIQLQQKKILKHLQISGLYFLPDYNKDWNNYAENFTYRGPKNFSTKYFYPKGWKGYAVDAMNMYEDTKDWLGRDGNDQEWWVAFHGTKQNYIRQIIQEGLKPGGGQAMANTICKITKQTTGVGVYFGNTIEVAQGYCSVYSFNNKNYTIALQCRVNPHAVRNPGGGGGLFGGGGGLFNGGGGLFNGGGVLFGNNQFQQQQLQQQDRFQHQRNEVYVVANPEDIRIYRILIKQQ